MAKVEVEIRSFISRGKYLKLLKFFNEYAKFLGKDFQETHYLDLKNDLRLQKGEKYAKIWMKSGKIHDEAREETEIFFSKNDFNKIKKIFSVLGFESKIIWRRIRNSFRWKGVNIYLDYTKGYGYIIEIEKISQKRNQAQIIKKLKLLLKELDVSLTPKKEFEQKYKYYQKNWRKLIK